MLVNLLFEIFTPIHIKRNSPLDSIQQSFPTSENPMKRQDLRHYLVHHQRQRLAESWSLKRQKLGPMMVQVMSMSGETKVSWWFCRFVWTIWFSFYEKNEFFWCICTNKYWHSSKNLGCIGNRWAEEVVLHSGIVVVFLGSGSPGLSSWIKFVNFDHSFGSGLVLRDDIYLLGGVFKYVFVSPTWGNDPNWPIFFDWVETTNKFVIYPREGIPTCGNLGVRLKLASLQANRVGYCKLNGSQNS